ncbi:MAG: DoxX family protein [Oligoflexia bacterium]|nr:DoxX family protein [Oligoflexia bacterium]
MIHKLIKTTDDIIPAVARIVAGFVILPHGLQKTIGLFGGHGFSGTMGFFTHTMGIPAPLAFLAIMAESAGALGLIVGLLSRVAAFGVASNMTVALFLSLPNGFFMNWSSNQKGEGIEYHLLMLCLTLIVMIRGGGAFSLDRKISQAGDP